MEKEQLTALLDAIPQENARGRRDYTLLLFMYNTGARVQEEGTILEGMLAGFTGVLVSDFYTAYDAPKCPQQKCLIHFMRDVNDDVFHNPFDEDLKQLAQKLVGLLKPIIDTVDTFGLTQRHLNKHKEGVARFFRFLTTQTYPSELARKYQVSRQALRFSGPRRRSVEQQ